MTRTPMKLAVVKNQFKVLAREENKDRLPLKCERKLKVDFKKSSFLWID